MNRGSFRWTLVAGLTLSFLTSPAASATHVRVVANSRFCGPSATGISTPSRGLFCVHSVADTLPAGRASTQGQSPGCYGPGTDGDRVQLIYAFPDGSRDNSRAWIPSITNTWVPNIEATVRRESKSMGREIGIRFMAPGCRLEVAVVRLPAATADGKDPQLQFGRIIEGLAAQGFDSHNRKYLVWFEGKNTGGVCGWGTVVPLDETPLPTNVHNGVLPEHVASPNVAMAYGPTCWGRGGTGALVETHELFHVLGSVLQSAPNEDGTAHCIDGPDIMCRQRSKNVLNADCLGPVEVLDCGKDDYFNPRPVAGSYLSSHWNTANSSFLQRLPVLRPLESAVMV